MTISAESANNKRYRGVMYKNQMVVVSLSTIYALQVKRGLHATCVLINCKASVNEALKTFLFKICPKREEKNKYLWKIWLHLRSLGLQHIEALVLNLPCRIATGAMDELAVTLTSGQTSLIQFGHNGVCS